ncbi:MAG TPA: hypothetical protein VIQ30_26710 [Pseudonocardia sp.]
MAVKKRMTTKGWLAKTGGAVLIVVGLGVFMLGFLTDIRFAGGPPVALLLAGGQAMIMGTGLYCYQQLLVRAIPTEQSLMYQKDIGYEQGWRDCEQYLNRPSLVDLDEYRARHEAIHS